MRILIAALALYALSFVLGVAGDLAASPPRHGSSVIVAIPPQPRHVLSQQRQAATQAHASPPARLILARAH